MQVSAFDIRYEEALQLALRIEGLVSTARIESSEHSDKARLVEALTGNLIDQLNMLRGPHST